MTDPQILTIIDSLKSGFACGQHVILVSWDRKNGDVLVRAQSTEYDKHEGRVVVRNTADFCDHLRNDVGETVNASNLVPFLCRFYNYPQEYGATLIEPK